MGVRQMLNICTWNVNGIRACHRKGFLDWLKKEQPDLLCLQETKAHPQQLAAELRQPPGYHTWFASAAKKGYAGTALYSRRSPRKVFPGLGIQEFDDEGRTVVADYGHFVIIGGYFPNSQPEGRRLDYKLAYNAAVLERCQELRGQGREVLICGDFNAAHTPIDLFHPKANEKNPGYLPEERAWVTHALSTGLHDIFRERHPGEPGHYTWWSYRARSRDRNIGWRLDYFLVTPGILGHVAQVSHLSGVLGSDHCPVKLLLDL